MIESNPQSWNMGEIGMKYLTNREAAQAMLDGKPLVFDTQSGMAICGMVINPHTLDEPSTARLAPETITRTITYPKPYSGQMEMGQSYYLAHPILAPFHSWQIWVNDETDNLWLSRGLIHLTEAAAVAHAKALIGGRGMKWVIVIWLCGAITLASNDHGAATACQSDPMIDAPIVYLAWPAAFVAVSVLGYGDHSRKSGICVNYPALDIAE